MSSRVGCKFWDSGSVQVGETVEFYYVGGSHSGTRKVKVLKINDDGFEGETEEGYRRFVDSKISGQIKVVADADTKAGETLRVLFSDAIDKLAASLSGEQLAELYSKYVAVEGDGAEFDANTGEVVVYLPAPKTKVNVPKHGNEIHFTNKKGEELSVYLYAGINQFGFHNDGTKEDNANATPEELLATLTKFLA